MNKARLGLCMVLFCAALLSSGCGGNPDAPRYADKLEFTAVMTFEDAGGPVENRIYLLPDRYRLESLLPGKGATIVRMDKGVVWSVSTEKRAYRERALLPADRNPLTCPPERITGYKKLGADTMGGHPVIVERLTMQVSGGDEMKVNRWFATDINWPLKAEAADGSWRVSYHDLKAGRQDRSLFEAPEGYEKS